VFTARYALNPYIKQIRFVFKELTAKGGEILQVPALTLLSSENFNLARLQWRIKAF
jgi:hypothetical protein